MTSLFHANKVLTKSDSGSLLLKISKEGYENKSLGSWKMTWDSIFSSCWALAFPEMSDHIESDNTYQAWYLNSTGLLHGMMSQLYSKYT